MHSDVKHVHDQVAYLSWAPPTRTRASCKPRCGDGAFVVSRYPAQVFSRVPVSQNAAWHKCTLGRGDTIEIADAVPAHLVVPSPAFRSPCLRRRKQLKSGSAASKNTSCALFAACCLFLPVLCTLCRVGPKFKCAPCASIDVQGTRAGKLAVLASAKPVKIRGQ